MTVARRRPHCFNRGEAKSEGSVCGSLVYLEDGAADQIVAQGAQSIGQSVGYSAGVRGDTFGVSNSRDYLRVRGFLPSYFQDGLILPYGIGSQGIQVDPFAMERIEILKGPSAGLYGQSPPGGILNMLSKRPTSLPQGETFIQGGNFDRINGGIDVSGPIDQEGQLFGRIVGIARTGNTQVQYVDDNRYYIAPSVTWRPTNDTSFTVLSSVQKDSGGILEQYLPAVGTLLPGPNGRRLSSDTNAGQPGIDVFNRDIHSVGYEFSHRFENDVTFRQNLRYTHGHVLNNSTIAVALLPDNATITRRLASIDRTLDYFTIDNQVSRRFDTGAIKHHVLVGVDYRNTKEFAINGQSAAVPNLNLYNPVYGGAMGPILPLQRFQQAIEQTGIYVQDQMQLDRWRLTLTGRHDWSNKTTNAFLPTPLNTGKTEEADTGRAGLTYLFDNGIAPYVSYATSFEQVLTPATSTLIFDPTRGKQFEIGVKYQPTWMKGLITASYFDLTQTNVPTVLGPTTFVQTGEVTSRGFELEARAEITDRASVIAAYSYTDTEVTRTVTANQLGKYFPSIPLNQASLWGQYKFPTGPIPGVKLGVGVRYVGSTFGDAVNTAALAVPDYALVDAMASWDIGEVIREAKGNELQVNATNLLDREVVSVCFNTVSCLLGQRRTVLATLKYRW